MVGLFQTNIKLNNKTNKEGTVHKAQEPLKTEKG